MSFLAGLAVRPFDMMTPLEQATRIRAGDTADEINQLQLANLRDARTDMQAYGNALQSGDPQAHLKLARQPQLRATAVQTETALGEEDRRRYETRLARNAEGAMRVSTMQGEERKAAWKEELDSALREGRVDQLTYQRLVKSEPSDQVLQNIIRMGAGVGKAVEMTEKDKDRKAGQEFASGLARALQPGAPAAPAAAAPSAAAPAPAPGAAPGKQSGYFGKLGAAESGNNPAAQASTSSAGGLFQFTEGTWNGLAQKYPDLQLTAEGRTDPKQVEQQQRAVRAFTRDNAATLASAGVIPTDANLRVAHFLGAKGAITFLNGVRDNPSAPATSLVSKEAADANRSVFYAADGTPLTAGAVYSRLTRGFGNDMTAVAELTGGSGSDTMTGGDTMGTGARTYGSTIAGIPAKNLVPFLVGAAAQPGLPKESRDVAMELLKTALTENKPTDEYRDYTQYVQQTLEAGDTPMSFFDYQVKKREAGSARTTVNIDQKAESALEKERGEGLGKSLNKLADDFSQATDDVNLYGRLGDLLERSGTGTGIAFTNWVRELSGIKLGDKANEAEAANALINYLKPRMRVPGSGASSDRDMQVFANSIPTLLSTPEGRRVVIETLGGAAKARLDRAEIAQRWQTGDITAKEAVADMRKLGDPFSSFREWQKSQEGKAGRATEKPAPPKKGEIVDGYEYLGGNPADPNSYRKVEE